MDEIFKILKENEEIEKVYFVYYKETSTTEPNHFYKEAEEASTDIVNYLMLQQEPNYQYYQNSKIVLFNVR